MIKKFVTEIALQVGVPISNVMMVEGHDVHFLQIFSGGDLVSTLIQKSELDKLNNGLPSNDLEFKIRNALTRLQFQLEFGK
jgi:hypothetical protein